MGTNFDEDPDTTSRSGKKRQLEVVQKLAKDLVDLSPGDFSFIDLDPEIRLQVEATRKIKAHGARRRQLRFLCGFIAAADLVSLQYAMDNFKVGKRADAELFHSLEVFRDRLIADDATVVAEIKDLFPKCNLKELKRLTDQGQHEAKDRGKPGAAYRALFRYLRQASAADKP